MYKQYKKQSLIDSIDACMAIFEKHPQAITDKQRKIFEASRTVRSAAGLKLHFGYKSTGALYNHVYDAVRRLSAIRNTAPSQTYPQSNAPLIPSVKVHAINLNGTDYVPMDCYESVLLQLQAHEFKSSRPESDYTAKVRRVSKMKISGGDVVEITVAGCDELFNALEPGMSIYIGTAA